jgi:predicted AAA+ superfamily ATPase
MAIVTDAQVIKVLQQYNPWWKTGEVVHAESKPYKRAAWHEAVKVMENSQSRSFSVLTGARKVGKTTVLFQLIEKLIDSDVSPKNIIYVPFDNALLKMKSAEEVLAIYEALHRSGEGVFLLLDEVQYSRDCSESLKSIYDKREDVRISAAMSITPIFKDGQSYHGDDFLTAINVPPLSFYEYCRFLEIEDIPEIHSGFRLSKLTSYSKGLLSNLMERFSPLQQHFNRYLITGGFPEAILSDDLQFSQDMLREDVVDKVIMRDTPALFNVRNSLTMEKLFVYLCMNSSDIFNKQSAVNDLDDIGISTVEDYLTFLEKSNLIYISAPLAVGTKAALKGKPKIYITDAAIRNAMLMIDDTFSDEREMAVMVETAVYRHIHSLYHARPDVSVGYYRKVRENQKEVDVVVKTANEVILCETNYRSGSSALTSGAIISLSKAEDCNVSCAFVITKSLTDYGIAKQKTKVPVFRIPALPFIYLLGRASAMGQSDM